ncbi:MAG: hypothetical protein JWM91_222 [Rhodospirillales bacterium]|nr:hypothetical protein [Rhodospirillales bacterium]
MPNRFPPGAAAYTKDGRRYIVDEVADGLVYCTASGGAETEFPEAQLMTEAEWSARTGGRRDMLYSRLKQARTYVPYKGALDRGGAQRLLTKAEQLFPGILDFAAFTVASRVLSENGDQSFIPELSIIKCREIFDGAPVETRAALLAGLLGTAPDKMVSAAGMGDNMTRAMIDKGLDVAAFDTFGSRRRR